MAFLLFILPIAMFVLWLEHPQHWFELSDEKYRTLFLYGLAWVAGMLGGTLFSIKWLYHSVAKQSWHLDRRLWRFFTPHISGGLAFIMIALISSGLFRVFDRRALESPPLVVGVAFLTGYFSDSAAAKFAEIGNMLFGQQPRISCDDLTRRIAWCTTLRDASPLRYPGGKWRISSLFERVILLNRLAGCDYFEPYAGGASLALSLLFANRVAEIHLNDLDPAIYAFWHVVLKRNNDLRELIESTEVTSDEWIRQKQMCKKGPAAGTLAFGFATFFLNRTNYSGILNGGMIGGKAQDGAWKLDARFNKPELIRRIKRIGSYKNRIHLSRFDAIDFLSRIKPSRDSLVYLDPPYYNAGAELYLNAYRPKDHAAVRRSVGHLDAPWIVSYDDVPEIRSLYRTVRSRRLELLHTARSSKLGREVLFFSPQLRIPTRR